MIQLLILINVYVREIDQQIVEIFDVDVPKEDIGLNY